MRLIALFLFLCAGLAHDVVGAGGIQVVLHAIQTHVLLCALCVCVCLVDGLVYVCPFRWTMLSERTVSVSACVCPLPSELNLNHKTVNHKTLDRRP
jgi:hypothetical protein